MLLVAFPLTFVVMTASSALGATGSLQENSLWST